MDTLLKAITVLNVLLLQLRHQFNVEMKRGGLTDACRLVTADEAGVELLREAATEAGRVHFLIPSDICNTL